MIIRFLLHWVALGVALYVVARFPIFGISYDNTHALIWAALALIIANTIVKPILVIITLPLVILTLGLFLLFINAFLLYILPSFVAGFHVANFTGAFFAAIVISLITHIFSSLERSATTTTTEAI